MIRELRGPVSIRFGESFTTTVRVCNEGTASTQGAFGTILLDLYLSADDTLSWPDPSQPPPTDQIQLGALDIPTLEAGQCATRGFTATATAPSVPLDGLYYLGAIVDAQEALIELQEDNNMGLQPMGVGHLPDVVITEIRGPDNIRSGDVFDHSVKVCNQGTQVSSPGIVDIYLSVDDSVSPTAPGTPPSTSQVLLDSIEVPGLNPGHCTLRHVESIATVPADTVPNQPLYLGAIADAQQASVELREDNNAFVSGPMGEGEGPDLVVTSLVAPRNVSISAQFASAVTVCNQGTQPAAATHVELHVSTDGSFSMPAWPSPLPANQEFVGTVNIPPLSPGHCVTRDTTAYAAQPVGSPYNSVFHLAALVDPYQHIPELREDNNIFISGLLGIGERPDLTVTELSAPNYLQGWTYAQVAVTICNEGTRPSGDYAFLELILSMSPALDMRDPYPYDSSAQSTVGGVGIPSLEVGQCVTQDVEIYALPPQDAPLTLDILHLGAIIHTEGSHEELREDNNLFVSGLLGTGDKPDLVITSLQAPTNVNSNNMFSVTANVCNQGTTVSAPTSLELTLSTHAFLNVPVSDGPFVDQALQASIGMIDVPQLGTGECRALSTNAQALNLPWSIGDFVYYLGGTIDPWASLQEFRRDNNTLVSGRIGVDVGPDLVVTDVAGPASTRRNGAFTAEVTVCNQGTDMSSPSQAQVFLSMAPRLLTPWPNAPNAPPPPDQALAGELDIPALHAGQCFTGKAPSSAAVSVDATSTAFYLGAIVDPNSNIWELRRDNNAFVGNHIGVGDASDLVISTLTGPPSVAPNETFTATVRVCNQGTETAGLVLIDLNLSTRPHLAMPDWYGTGSPFPDTQIPVGGTSVPFLNAGSCVTTSITAIAMPPFGATPHSPLYLGAIVDPMSTNEELREDNNTFISGLIGVGNRPDLVVTGIQAPANVAANASFSTTLTVCNQGTQPSSSSFVDVYVSSTPELAMPRLSGQEQSLPATQSHAGGMSVPSLNVGRCFEGTVIGTSTLPSAALPDQPLFVGAIVDGVQHEEELREDNNSFVSGRIGIGLGPDLVITSVTGPASVWPNSDFIATVSVCNQGTQASANNTQVELHFSTEPRLVIPPEYSTHGSLPANQALINIATLPALEADDCLTLDVPAYANPPPAAPEGSALYLGAIVDVHQQNAELRTDNNTYVGGLVGVGSRADLVITAITGPTSIHANANFQANVTVCNQGTMPSNDTRLDMYLSTTSQLAMPTWGGTGSPFPDSQSYVGNRGIEPLEPGECKTALVYVQAAPPYEALPNQPLYLGAAIDVYQDEAELREDNNTFVGDLMGVGSRPDVVVTSISSPSSARTGSAFTATVMACNHGTTSSGSFDVALYLSSNDEHDFPHQYGPESPSESQVLIGTVPFYSLAAGQCLTRSGSVSATTPPDSGPTGFFYLGAIADPGEAMEELREDNNVLADRLIMVTP
ncbi:CARDB domain-containing protein [Myxococcus sp. Y35]|uniref:CARDB domain-containing protein n=1 Tax=Pseudomyxococcus flavus TaxID=3115648 RepID=UPI003CF521BF